MALKKPSDYFKKNEEISSIDNGIQKNVDNSEIETFSDAFLAFKNNLSKIEILSEFSETLDNYNINIEKVNYLSDKITDIQEEVKNLLKKEDLDRAMMSQLLVVEHSICDVQNRVKAINEKNLTEIRLDVSNLTNSVNDFIEVEVPKYKNLVVDSEIRNNTRYEKLEEEVNKTLEGISEFVGEKYQELTETLTGINENSLSVILEDFKSLEKTVLKLKEEEIPKYKGFIVETERKNQVKLDEFQTELDKTISHLLEKLTLVEGDKNNLVDAVNKKIDDVKNLRKTVINELKNNNTYKEQINKKLTDLEVEVIRNESSIQKQLDKKVSNLEYEIIKNESYIKAQNDNINEIKDNIQTTIKKLNIEKLEEKNYELTKKIKYLEEVFAKFNEKEILTENLIVQPPSTKNKDSLTPLDQNFVTLDQLQQHYRLFINRIQQQLATIGGGGETRLEFLDDVDRNSAKQNGYVLQYNSALGKFIGTSYVSGSGTGGTSYWVGTNAGIYTTRNVAIGTDVVSLGSTALLVHGDARITGILSIGTGTITLDPNENTIHVGTGITINSVEGTIQISGSTIGSPSGNAFYTGIVTAASFDGNSSSSTYATTSGISTYATSSGIATYASNAGIATTATYLTDASNILTGTINKDRISSTNSLNVIGDLYVKNNISFGGTTTQLNLVQLEVVDPDIVLGIGTSFSPTDNTANHGGIAIASTEGTPLVNLNIIPEETNPPTYKKMMWFKGDTIGAGITDAWLFNYAVGIGSTQVPNGVRLAAGSIKVSDDELNVSGIVSATTFYGDGSNLSNIITGIGIGTTASSLTGIGVTTIIFNGTGISTITVSNNIAEINITNDVSPKITTGSSPPENPQIGDIWIYFDES